jgi:hypothetical protein
VESGDFVPNIIRLIAACAVATVIAVPAALAQDVHNGTGTMMVGGMEISVGAGVATLDLPDVRFGTTFSNQSLTTDRHRFPNSNNFDHEWGPSITAGVVVPWSGPTALAVTGFFSNIEDKHTVHCLATLTTSCATVDPTGTQFPDIAPDINEKTKRDVDNWGVQVEGRYYLNGPIVAPRFLRSTYLGAGGDVRAILQDTTINSVSPQFPDSLIRYDESLDTRYYGGYLAIGGDYSIFPGLDSGWGISSSFKAHVGVYSAQTDYDGSYKEFFIDTPASITRLSKSDDQATVIAGLSFETRKQFGPRVSLSLLSEYDWYSSVPKMRYADFGGKTTIEDDSALATRTTLRLNIGLGSAALYEEPLK